MARAASKELDAETMPGMSARMAELEGYTVAFLTFTEDADITPLLKGLPGDLCQCPHWGVVLKGQHTYRLPAGDEVHRAGDAYYVPGGHSYAVKAGTEVIEFGPTAELNETMAVIMKNIEETSL